MSHTIQYSLFPYASSYTTHSHSEGLNTNGKTCRFQ